MTAPWIVAFACLWLVVVLLGFAVVGVMRRMVGVLERAEQHLATEPGGVPLLTSIPPFQLLDDATGEAMSSEEVIREPSIVLFMESGCKPCQALATKLDDADLSGVPLIVIAGEEGLNERFRLPVDVPVFRQRDREVADLFRSASTPHAFVVDRAGVVLDRAVPGSVAHLEELARRQIAGAKTLEGVAGD